MPQKRIARCVYPADPVVVAVEVLELVIAGYVDTFDLVIVDIELDKLMIA